MDRRRRKRFHRPRRTLVSYTPEFLILRLASRLIAQRFTIAMKLNGPNVWRPKLSVFSEMTPYTRSIWESMNNKSQFNSVLWRDNRDLQNSQLYVILYILIFSITSLVLQLFVMNLFTIYMCVCLCIVLWLENSKNIFFILHFLHDAYVFMFYV